MTSCLALPINQRMNNGLPCLTRHQPMKEVGTRAIKYKMLFVGIDEKGEKGGMVSRIAENILNRFVSVNHYGLVKADKEITEGPEVEKWANGFENYTFEENNGTTTVTVDLDTTEDFLDYMNQTYPKALDKLKELCEKK
jgi:hypothetical protein